MPLPLPDVDKGSGLAAAIPGGRPPDRAIMIERTIAAIVIPALFAYIPYALLT
jgi:hypothetical protein